MTTAEIFVGINVVNDVVNLVKGPLQRPTTNIGPTNKINNDENCGFLLFL